MKKIKKNLECLTRVSSMADNAFMLGNITEEEHKDLKGKTIKQNNYEQD